MINIKFIPRGLPRDKMLGDCQEGEAKLFPLDQPGAYTSGAGKNLIARVILGLCFFVFFGLAKAEIELNKIVAIVNSDVITRIDLDKKIVQMRRYYQGSKIAMPGWTKMRKKALGDLIDIALQLQIAKRNNVVVSDAEVDKVIANIAKGNGITVEQLKAELPKRENMSFSEFRNKIREQVLVGKVQQQFLARNVVVDKKDIDVVLRNPPKIKEIPAEYHVFDVVLEFLENGAKGVTKGMRNAAKKVALILKKKGEIEDLVERAKKAVKDQVIVGNDLGWRKIDACPKLFVKHIKKMGVGQVVGPIEAPNGLHLLKMMEIKKAKAVYAKITKDQAAEIAYHRKLEKKLKPWLEELRKNAYIKYY